MTALLEARDLAIGHGRRVVAEGISLALKAGRVLCLLGPNGGGKTTLLRTLLGLIPPLSGTVRLSGEDLRGLPRREVALRLAYVPQAAPGGFAFPAREVVAMGRAARLPLLAAPGRRDREAAEAALARLGIAHLADRPVTELSGGERQLVLIARALAQEAACLVLDEPTASLDFGNQALVLRQIRALAARDGLGVLMTTHHPDHAFLVADAAAVLHRGGLDGPAPPEAIVTPARLRAAYGVETVIGTVETPEGPRRVCAPVVAGGMAATPPR
ncbi:ABC transporter ATP-binding protein [Paracraurococcus lichenis]|uniref:ABC transporter ATP-binding protein n=1 Tax=Paracraurococcus lichenis TaxID=3064888 RepID=A0ABT9E4M2_9PROT|nr:ABC transporter ATP-binding protein [Paracraurococcus sp. LOR1-02]MDO9711126.1 ABC transporter ATP-binding protein [Paracraurococcus sp. LOR1-02]